MFENLGQAIPILHAEKYVHLPAVYVATISSRKNACGRPGSLVQFAVEQRCFRSANVASKIAIPSPCSRILCRFYRERVESDSIAVRIKLKIKFTIETGSGGNISRSFSRILYDRPASFRFLRER